MYYVYIIQGAKNNKFYTGHTEDLNKRLKEHNKNQVRSTRNKGPYSFICKEGFVSRQEALKREKQIKRYKGGRFFKKLISNVPIV